MTSINSLELEVIDFDPFIHGPNINEYNFPSEAQKKISSQIDASFRKNGFIVLQNFGLDPRLLEDMKNRSRQFFSLDENTKMHRLKQMTVIDNVGYVSPGKEVLNQSRAPDIKEAFNFRDIDMFPDNFKNCPEEFTRTAIRFHQIMKETTRTFSVACALALGLPNDFFYKTLEKYNQCAFRLIHYPPTEYIPGVTTGENAKSALRVSEHTDFGMFTFLFTDGPGLQVKAIEGGEIKNSLGNVYDGWLDVPVQSNTVAIVNTGALLARWTNDIWRATAHRVVIANQQQAESHRYSIACFVDPDKDALVEVHPKFVADGEQPKYKPTTGHAYLLQRLQEARGY